MTAIPAMSDYQAAMQNPHLSLVDADLKLGRVDPDPLGLPRVVSGGFALTYSMSTPGGRYAVRCFHRHVPDLAARYTAIQPEVASRPRHFVRVEYQSQGVRVGTGVYPILKMPWVEGVHLGTWLRRGVTASAIERLEGHLRTIQGELEADGISHGDLQHGNVLIDPQGAVRLIDYDGMFVPALRGRAASEAGHVNYQHPLRRDQYDATLDRFPVMALTTALRAIRADSGIWARYDNDENVLFTSRDLVDPTASRLFQDLLRIPAAAPLAERLARIATAPFASIPTVEDFLSGAFTVVARAATGTRPVARSQYPVVDASDRTAVLAFEGAVATIVGRIVGLLVGTTRTGQPFAFLNFGDWKQGAATLVLWAEALVGNEAMVRALNGQVVSVTGLVSSYTGRTHVRPQIVVDTVAAIQRLTSNDAADLLAPGQAQAPPVVEQPQRVDRTTGTPWIDPVAAQRWGDPLGLPTRKGVPASTPVSAGAKSPQSPPAGVNTPRARRPAPASPNPPPPSPWPSRATGSSTTPTSTPVAFKAPVTPAPPPAVSPSPPNRPQSSTPAAPAAGQSATQRPGLPPGWRMSTPPGAGPRDLRTMVPWVFVALAIVVGVIWFWSQQS